MLVRRIKGSLFYSVIARLCSSAEAIPAWEGDLLAVSKIAHLPHHSSGACSAVIQHEDESKGFRFPSTHFASDGDERDLDARCAQVYEEHDGSRHNISSDLKWRFVIVCFGLI